MISLKLKNFRNNLQRNLNYKNLFKLKTPTKFSAFSAYPPLPIETIDKNPQEFIFSNSQIRFFNIGKNYFRHINPRRKKLVLTLLNSYFKQIDDKETVTIVLDLFYNNTYKGKKISELNDDEMDFNESILWHLHSLMILDRIASQYARFEFMEYDEIIKNLNTLPRSKRNRAKYVFTNQPNQPNSTGQLYSLNEIIKGIEENDIVYLDHAMKLFQSQNLQRKFKSPSSLEELITNYSSCIPDLLNSLSNMNDLGLKDLDDFFETPETLVTFESHDNDAETKFSHITYIHGLNINITIDQYIKFINEAELSEEMAEIIGNFEIVKNYADTLMKISDAYRNNQISKADFFLQVPVKNILGIESRVKKCLKYLLEGSVSGNSEKCVIKNRKVEQISKKLLDLLNIFRLVGVMVQIRISGEDLKSLQIKPSLDDILKEFSILNSNVPMGTMIVFDYQNQNQYDNLQKLLLKYQMTDIEIVPIIKSSKYINDTNSKITLISASHARMHEGLLLTELRKFREYKNNPNKWIYTGQGNTAERGGGPFGLTHQSYNALTRVQRERHIRSIQGYYFTSEFCSQDLIFAFLLNGANHLTLGDDFEPTTEYLDFLLELDSVVGAPQRAMKKTKEYNQLYCNNPIIKTLVEKFDYSGSEYKSITLENITESSGIEEAYIYSDRCSFTNPELAFWDRVDEKLIKKMAKTYYDNNRHFKFILYTYAFMLKRSDLEFAQIEVGLDCNNPIFKNYIKGRNALEKILDNIGLSPTSSVSTHIYNQHLGLMTNSSNEEKAQKFEAYRMIYLFQNYFLRRYLKFKKIENEEKSNIALNKMRIMQSALANISTFNGKG